MTTKQASKTWRSCWGRTRLVSASHLVSMLKSHCLNLMSHHAQWRGYLDEWWLSDLLNWCSSVRPWGWLSSINGRISRLGVHIRLHDCWGSPGRLCMCPGGIARSIWPLDLIGQRRLISCLMSWSWTLVMFDYSNTSISWFRHLGRWRSLERLCICPRGGFHLDLRGRRRWITCLIRTWSWLRYLRHWRSPKRLYMCLRGDLHLDLRGWRRWIIGLIRTWSWTLLM
jgi:hypothetical protein